MARRPRILMVSGNGPPVIDGVGDYTARLMRELAARRPEWTWLWLTRRPRWFHAPMFRQHGVWRLRPSHSWSPAGQALAATAARLVRPDLVHVQDQIHSYHETGAAARIAGATAAPVVVNLHEYHVELPSVVHTDALVKGARVLIANDPRNAERCLERTGRSVDHSWWSAGTVEPPQPGERPPTRPGLVVTFGFLSRIKALDVVHEALARLRASRPELRWRIIGPFDPRGNPFHAELAARFSPDWVEFTGAVRDQAVLGRLLAEASLMLLPFADGASPRRTTLQVGWAFGLPVITTPPTTPSDVVTDGDDCLLVRDGAADAWASAVERVLGNPALAEHLRAGSLLAADRYSWARLSALHLDLYDEVLARPRGQADLRNATMTKV